MSKIEYKAALKALLAFIVDIGFSNLVFLILPSMVNIAIPAKSLVVFFAYWILFKWGVLYWKANVLLGW